MKQRDYFICTIVEAKNTPPAIVLAKGGFEKYKIQEHFTSLKSFCKEHLSLEVSYDA